MASRSEATINDGRKEHLFKVLVIGDCRAGKTSYIESYVKKIFNPHIKRSIGVDYSLKVINWNDSTIVRFQLWDIAGEEYSIGMTRTYYKDAVGCLIVYDVTRRPTFDNTIKWKEDLDSKIRLPNGNKIPCVLLGSKKDLLTNDGKSKKKKLQVERKGCQDDDMNKFCEDHGFLKWIEVSSLTNENIDASAEYLIEEILKAKESLNPEVVDPDPDILVLEPDNPRDTKQKYKCC